MYNNVSSNFCNESYSTYLQVSSEQLVDNKSLDIILYVKLLNNVKYTVIIYYCLQLMKFHK